MLSITLGHTDRPTDGQTHAHAHRQLRLSNCCCCCCSARVKWMNHQQHPRVWQVAGRLLRLRPHKGNGSEHCVYNGFVMWRNGMEDGEGEARGLDSRASRAAAAAGINRVHQGRWAQRVLRVCACECVCVRVFFLFFSTPFCCLSTHLDIYAVMYFSSQWLLIGRITVNDRNALAGGGNAEATTALSCTLILFFHR